MEPRSRNHRPLHLAPVRARTPSGAVRSPEADPAEPTAHVGLPEPPPLTDERAAACSDSGLIAAIRECEALRHRLLHDQLALLTEARRRGLRTCGGPRRTSHDPADAEGAPT